MQTKKSRSARFNRHRSLPCTCIRCAEIAICEHQSNRATCYHRTSYKRASYRCRRVCYVSPKCFARNLREIARDLTPSRPRDDGMIWRFGIKGRSVAGTRGNRRERERERIEMKATRFVLVERKKRAKQGKLNAIECKMSVRSRNPWQFLGIGSFAAIV